MKPCPVCGSESVDYGTCGMCIYITCASCGCSTRPVIAAGYKETIAAKVKAFDEWERMHERRTSDA